MEVQTVVIFGEKGRLIINESDLPEWRKAGYRPENEIKVEAAKTKPDGKKSKANGKPAEGAANGKPAEGAANGKPAEGAAGDAGTQE